MESLYTHFPLALSEIILKGFDWVIFKDNSKIESTQCQFFLFILRSFNAEYNSELLVRTQIFYNVLLDS